MDLTAHWSRRIREARQHKGWSQRTLAKLAGCSQQSLSDIEAGEYKPGDDLRQRLARAINTPIYELFDYPDEQEADQ